MDKPNIVLIVLDTLREDSSHDLARLKEMGFIELEAIATSSWTLPSHVSMFTSELPSEHGVREYKGIGWSELMKISRERMRGATILSSLKAQGYITYGYSANLFVTPQFGFTFDHHKLFGEGGEIEGGQEPGGSPMVRRLLPLLFRKGVLGGALRWVAVGVVGRALRAAGVQKLEKGSRPIIGSIASTRFDEPFFAFVNLMESHQPYIWWILDTLVVRLSLLGMRPRRTWWKEMYPQHSSLAVSRGIDAVSHFAKSDALIVVTSDHGQLLGENGRYGHGFSLDDDLVKVPLFVRLPSGWEKLEVAGPVISLAEVAKMVKSVAKGEACAIGSDYAMAESWGEGNYREGETSGDADMHQIFLGRVGAGRVKVASKRGSVLVNRETHAIEEVNGDLTSDEADSLSKKVGRESVRASQTQGSGITQTDEKAILGRLRQLGYE